MAEGYPSAHHEDDPTNLIDEAFAFFAKASRDWVRMADADRHAQRVKSLRVATCDLLRVVAITLEREDNAQVIFETLNARGTPLLALDLVKNAVFLEAARRGERTDELYERLWKPQLDDDYWRRTRRQGRLNRPVGELFLMHWLTMKLGKATPATELYQTFRNSFVPQHRPTTTGPTPSIVDLLEELCRDAQIMRSFDNLPQGTIEATFFRRLDALDTSTVIPLVLLLFREPSVTIERRRRALRILESWLVRQMLMGLTTSNYNNLVVALTGRVRSDPGNADDVLLHELRSGTKDIDVWPSDDSLRSRLTTQTLYGSVSQQRVTMVLAAIEESLYSNKVEAIQVPKGLSVEHVIPQSWAQNWPLPNEQNVEAQTAAEQERSARLHRLGNLTLATSALNSAMSNDTWKNKQGHLLAHTRLLLNARLVAEYPEVFDEAAIDARGAELTERVIAIWPGPGSW